MLKVANNMSRILNLSDISALVEKEKGHNIIA
jgi:hypothetical protein